MRTEKTTIYQFSELSDEAKEKAREWWREGGMDYEWWDFIYDDAVQCAEALGISIDHRPGRNGRGEPTKGQPTIYFSGFWSQGDGACFEGDYSYRKGWRKALNDYAPKDSDLFRIGKELQDAQRKLNWQGSATIKHVGHYYHQRSISVTVMDGEGSYVSREHEDAISECMSDFCSWIYKRLEEEYDYRMSDEAVDETIEANEYEFTVDGERW